MGGPNITARVLIRGKQYFRVGGDAEVRVIALKLVVKAKVFGKFLDTEEVKEEILPRVSGRNMALPVL